MQQQLQQLDEELRDEIAAVEERFTAGSEPLERLALKPKKANVSVRLVSLAWAPYSAGPDGNPAPAW